MHYRFARAQFQHTRSLVAVGQPGRAVFEQPLLETESDMKTLLNKLVREEQGQDVIEYALLAAGISIVVIPTVPVIGTTLDAVYVKISTAVKGI